MIEDIQIARVELPQADEVIAFVRKTREELFPMLEKDHLPADLLDFKAAYLDDEVGAFLTARDADQRIVGAIGMLRYDGRFPFLALPQTGTVEIVRLYVEPTYRRLGLAARLFDTLTQLAAERAIQTCYLHTHPFLPGAVEFWKHCGFRVIAERKHGEFDTIHMFLANQDHV